MLPPNEKLPDDLKALYGEIIRREGLDLRMGCFDEQESFLLDPSTIKGAQTSRRAGKTHTAGVHLIEGAREQPGSMNPYIALTRDSAARILWPTLESLNRQFNLRARMIESKLTMHFENGSQLFLVGADQKNFIERLRGIRVKRGAIDEIQSFGPHVEELIFDVMVPSLVDFNGQLGIFGTPGVRPQGFFYDVCNKDRGIPVHRWTLFENPFMPNARQFIEKFKKQQGWTDENPTYRREWLNEWVLDLDALVYKFRYERDTYEDLERRVDDSWLNILGVDFGYSPDPCAFVVVSFSLHSPVAKVVYAHKEAELPPSLIAERIRRICQDIKISKIVADTGALGKSIAAELTRRHQLPIYSAEKKEKLMNQQLMNGDFIDGKLKIEASLKDLIHQLQTLTKDETGEEDKRLPNDLCDALLYAWRESKAYAWQPKPHKIAIDSEEFMEQFWEREAAKVNRQEQSAEVIGDDW